MEQRSEESVLQRIQAVDQSVVAVSNGCAHFTDHETLNSLAEVADALSPLESAKFDVTVAYSIASLYYVYLRTKGVSQKSHPIKGELDRIKNYVDRLKRIEATVAEKASPRPDTDASAARRMIEQQLGRENRAHQIEEQQPDSKRQRKDK